MLDPYYILILGSMRGTVSLLLQILPFLHERHANVLDWRVQLKQELSVLARICASTVWGGSKDVKSQFKKKKKKTVSYHK